MEEFRFLKVWIRSVLFVSNDDSIENFVNFIVLSIIFYLDNIHDHDDCGHVAAADSTRKWTDQKLLEYELSSTIRYNRTISTL